MRTLEYGKEHEKTLLFLPCTAEPEWAFADSVGLLSQDYHVIQIVYDGHGETGEDFISVETTVDEVTDWLQARGIMNAIDEMSALNRDLKKFFDEHGAAYPVWQALEAEAGRYLQ